MMEERKKTNKGKIIIAVILAIVIIAVLGNIFSSNEPTKEANNGNEISNVDSSSNEKETFDLNETAVFKNLKITATEIKKDTGSDLFKPEEGNIFLGVKFTIENISDEDQALSTLLLFDAYADDVKCAYSINASVALQEGTLDGSLSPGKKMTGYYAVEVPEGTQIIDLEVKSSWLSSSKATFRINLAE